MGRKSHNKDRFAPPNKDNPLRSPTTNTMQGRDKKMVTEASLPSNWDRYDELDSDESAELLDSGDPANKYIDVVKPKSKGADFGYLVAQAKSVFESNSRSASFDDVLPDFCQGLDAMLSVKGERLLTWTGGDNFLVDDEAINDQEVPNLSLDLDALAEQLAQVDLAKCLFVEADLLPPEMCTHKADEDMIQVHLQPPSLIGEGSEGTGISDEVAFKGVTERVDGNQDHKIRTFNSTSDIHLHPASIGRGQKSVDHIIDSAPETQSNDLTEKNNEQPRFEAASVEAELDMLLSSFSDSKPIDSSGDQKYAAFSGISKEYDSYMPVGKGNFSANPDMTMTAPPTPGLDDDIDDLLKETSNLNQHEFFQPSGMTPIPLDKSSSSNPVLSTEVLEDFDSWIDTL